MTTSYEPDDDEQMQLADYVAQRGIKVRILDGPETFFETIQGQEYKRYRFRVQLRLDGRTANVRFTQGEQSNDDPNTVDAADVLYCMLMDASFGEYDFPEFCRESGFDSFDLDELDGAMRTWKACKREAQRLPRFLGGEEEFDRARNTQH